MSFLRNAWHVAARDDEAAAGALSHRVIPGERPVLVRDCGGTMHAARDRCLHRVVPLHLGTRHSDVIECACHGLRLGTDGRCVRNPQGDGAIPANARVTGYPLIASDGLLWIWMGDPALADEGDVPRFVGLDPATDAINEGHMQPVAVRARRVPPKMIRDEQAAGA